MKVLIKIVLMLGSVALLNGCFVSHSGTVSSGPLLKVSDQYTDMAEGRAKSVFVFGFGDLNKENLVMEARRNMYYNHPLKKNEYYSNFSTSVTNKFILAFIHVTKVSVSADLMTSTEGGEGPFSLGFSNKVSSDNMIVGAKPTSKGSALKKSIKGELSVGDSVYFSSDGKNYRLYKVSSFDKENTMITSCDEESKNLLTSLDGRFFKKNREAFGFKHGDLVSAEIINGEKFGVLEDGRILGIDTGFFLVESKSGTFILPETKIKHK